MTPWLLIVGYAVALCLGALALFLLIWRLYVIGGQVEQAERKARSLERQMAHSRNCAMNGPDVPTVIRVCTCRHAPEGAVKPAEPTYYVRIVSDEDMEDQPAVGGFREAMFTLSSNAPRTRTDA